MLPKPTTINLNDHEQYRIIPSVYPPINFFEKLVDPNEMEMLWEIEQLTNERLYEETGDIFLVEPQDRIVGSGSSVVMAAFTHIHYPSRFTDGSFGIYYASLCEETAIRETVYHREDFLNSTREAACEITMRMYKGKIKKPLHDIRNKHYKKLHHETTYSDSQVFGFDLRTQNSWGLIYNSVRHSLGTCIAAFRPPTISIPIQTKHLKYIWDGNKISDVLEVHSVLKL